MKTKKDDWTEIKPIFLEGTRCKKSQWICIHNSEHKWTRGKKCKTLKFSSSVTIKLTNSPLIVPFMANWRESRGKSAVHPKCCKILHQMFSNIPSAMRLTGPCHNFAPFEFFLLMANILNTRERSTKTLLTNTKRDYV